MAKLYIVGTPIGNLEDISLRAMRILREVDCVLCEDTRVTRKLLEHFDIKTPTRSLHQHSSEKEIAEALDLLKNGQNLALVSDAGTPGISDPGGKLIAALLEADQEAEIESVPGPSAVTAALSISGIPTDKFLFMGFPPHKKGRQKFLQKIADSDYPAVIYESKHRILKFLEELKSLNQEIIKKNQEIENKKIAGYAKNDSVERKKSPVTGIVVCREISKLHETVYRGEIEDIINKIKANRDDQRGEFTVVVGK